MKTKLISLGLIFLIIGCNMTQQDDRATGDTDEKSAIDSAGSAVYDPLEAIWRYDFNQQTEEFEVEQLRSVDRETLTGETLEKIIINHGRKCRLNLSELQMTRPTYPFRTVKY
jgi:hypothetical protein